MKRLFALFLLLLILCGCGAEEPLETIPMPPPEPEYIYNWVQGDGEPWDSGQVLWEAPLMIPAQFSIGNAMEYDGDLLLWNFDDHLENLNCLELCLIELDTGKVVAENTIPVRGYTIPQSLGEDLYLCDNMDGIVYRLDKALKIKSKWNPGAEDATWYVAHGEKLYTLGPDCRLRVRNLNTPEGKPVLPEDPECTYMSLPGDYLKVEYYHPGTGTLTCSFVDLETGEVLDAAAGWSRWDVEPGDGMLLYSRYSDGYHYRLDFESGEVLVTDTGEDYLTLTDDGQIIRHGTSGNISLYNSDGAHLSTGQLSENGTVYGANELIWNQEHMGYFFLIYSNEMSSRLLFWDINAESAGEDLVLTSAPTPTEAEAALETRLEAIAETYGLTVLVGEDCEQFFNNFEASWETDLTSIHNALDELEKALAAYPEGFFRQLRYDSIRGIEIQLVTDLIATGNGRSGDGYSAFAEAMWDHYLIVVDIADAWERTYYHEFSHIIDKYLEWDSQQRTDALFSEDGWNDYNPRWFQGYTYDYSWEQYVEDYAYFVSGYSTISPTEDRAQILEFAMDLDGGGMFAGCKGLIGKLEYYCRCIRDAFDTTGWPEITRWERYIS